MCQADYPHEVKVIMLTELNSFQGEICCEFWEKKDAKDVKRRSKKILWIWYKSGKVIA